MGKFEGCMNKKAGESFECDKVDALGSGVRALDKATKKAIEKAKQPRQRFGETDAEFKKRKAKKK